MSYMRISPDSDNDSSQVIRITRHRIPAERGAERQHTADARGQRQEDARNASSDIRQHCVHQQESASQPSRGSEWSQLLSCTTSVLLRLGFLLQILALVFGSVIFWSYSGLGYFTFDLFNAPEEQRYLVGYAEKLVWLELVNLAGAVCIMNFQKFLADDSKSPRGFRTGSKLLCTASTLDMITTAIRLVQTLSAKYFLSERWWKKHQETTSEWCFYHSAGMLHGLSLLLYGLAIFYLESYHARPDHSQWHIGIVTFGFYALASFLEIMFCVIHHGAAYVGVQTVAVLCALIWSVVFEPAAQRISLPFHDGDLHAGVPTLDDDDEDYEQD